MAIELPALPFERTALEPHISGETIDYHYGKHHKAYVDKLNELTPGTEFADMSLEEIIKKSDGTIFNNAAQVWNHTFYWYCLQPGGGKEPSGKLADAINAAFGDFATFKEEFTKTAIGTFGGTLKDVPLAELATTAVKAAVARSGVAPDRIGHLAMGNVIPTEPRDAYLSRVAALEAGLPQDTPAFNVNRLCGSGLQAIWSAAMEMRWNDLDFTLAGGDESMTRMPFYDFGARSGYKLGNRQLQDGTVLMLTDPFHDIHMGVTAENVAKKYGVSREEQDEFALESQRRAATPEAQAAFAEEITPFEVGGRKPFTADKDEHPKPDTTLETLAKLRPAFAKDGTVTAGNASGINDGAASVVLGRESAVAERGLTGLVSLEAVATAAMEPELMGYAPTHALRALFEKTGTSPSDIGSIELNEAFASQAVAVIRDTELDPARVNPYGGAIALGHPVGATGAILTLRLAKDMVRRDLELGIVTMCIGGGQALAAMFRRI